MAKPPTVYDVATSAGVSIATVSRVFTTPETVKEATRSRVLAAVHELGYVPSGSARGLAARRTGVLGLFFPGLDALGELRGHTDFLAHDVAAHSRSGERTDERAHERAHQPESATGSDTSPPRTTIIRDIPARADTRALNLYLDEVLRGSELEAWRSGRVLLVGVGRGETSGQTVLDMAGRVDGLIVLAGSATDEELTQLARRIPIVVMAGPRRGDDFDHVSVSNSEGMEAITAHLVDDLGVTDIVYLAGSATSPDDHERWTGFLQALTSRGLTPPDKPWLRGDFTREGGRAAGRVLFSSDELPRAIICANDQMALGVIDSARIAGVDVPGDLIVTGFDGIDAGDLSTPRLTTVSQPMESLGRAAVQVLVHRLEDPERPSMSVRLPVEVLLRESSELV
ncbi:LacI family DNA-binding transcriptional regulator [Plantibacter sp. YIM 135347]|uniref:LacI family DNA-binding transcriptional regulator n=1 Tax=Plantibacter sp. YIM 135347 TaxID=3423919 RepID=UPI003D34D95D